MWSPTSRQKRALCLCTLLAVSMLLLGGCGYQFAGKEKGIFGSPTATLRLAEVENPSMYAWLPQRLRSAMHDEVNRRNLATWVDAAPSDYTMRIKISEFTLRSHVKDSTDTTLLYTANLNFEATVYSGSTNSVVWRSGSRSLARTYDTKDPQTAGTDAAKLLVQYICDSMRNSF